MRKKICIFVMTLLIATSIGSVLGTFNEKANYIDNHQKLENTDWYTIDISINNSYINGNKTEDLDFGNWVFNNPYPINPQQPKFPWYIIKKPEKPKGDYAVLEITALPCVVHSFLANPLCDDGMNPYELTEGNFEGEQDIVIKINGEDAGNLHSEFYFRQTDEYSFQCTISFNLVGWEPDAFSVEDILNNKDTMDCYWKLKQQGQGQVGGDYYLSINLPEQTVTFEGERTINYQTTNQLPFDEIVHYELLDYYYFESNGSSIIKYNAYIEQDDGFNLEIVGISGGFGLTFTIQNNGETESAEEDWYLRITGPMVLIGANQEGIIPPLGSGDTIAIKSGLILGLGKIGIEVQMDEKGWSFMGDGILIGPIILGV